MRSAFTATAALIAATLLTGCGSDTAGDAGTNGGKATTESQSASPTPAADGEKHTVTLEVPGSGSTQIMYKLNGNAFETHKLPWTKTETVELTAAEQRVGYLVAVTPGSVQAGDGMLKMAGCVIKVDGKQVADNKGGKSGKPCEYLVK